MCESCLHEILEKLTTNDIYVLYNLKECADVHAGLTKSDIKKKLTGSNISDFQLRQSLMRLQLVSLIKTTYAGRKSPTHSITEEGLYALNLIG